MVTFEGSGITHAGSPEVKPEQNLTLNDKKSGNVFRNSQLTASQSSSRPAPLSDVSKYSSDVDSAQLRGSAEKTQTLAERSLHLSSSAGQKPPLEQSIAEFCGAVASPQDDKVGAIDKFVAAAKQHNLSSCDVAIKLADYLSSHPLTSTPVINALHSLMNELKTPTPMRLEKAPHLWIGTICLKQLLPQEMGTLTNKAKSEMKQACMTNDLVGLCKSARQCQNQYISLSRVLRDVLNEVRRDKEFQNKPHAAAMIDFLTRAGLYLSINENFDLSKIADFDTAVEAAITKGDFDPIIKQGIEAIANGIDSSSFLDMQLQRMKALSTSEESQTHVQRLSNCIEFLKNQSDVESNFEPLMKKGLDYIKPNPEQMKAKFTEVFSEPLTNAHQLHACIDEAKAINLEVQPILESVLGDLRADPKTKPEVVVYVERVLQKFSALQEVSLAEVHKLDPYELLRITAVAEHAISTATENIRLKKTTENKLARSVLIDADTKSFTILLGKLGPVYAEGGQGKIRSIIVVADQAIHDVRKTPKRSFTSTRLFSDDEVRIAKMFMKIGTVVEYTNGPVTKQSINMERFDGDFEQVIAKGNQAFDSEKEMLEAFDQIFTTIKSMHTHEDEHGKPSPIVHGDLKSANLLYKKGKTQVADFGFAEEITKTKPEEKRDVPMHPTLRYSSPEDVLRREGVEMTDFEKIARDMWSVGCILGEFISACVCSDGQGQDPDLWAEGDPPWISQIRTKQDITSTVEATRQKLMKIEHPLAPLAAALLHPDPSQRLNIEAAHEMLTACLNAAKSSNKQ